MHNRQEAVNADAGEEEDAAVHVGVEQGHGDLAQHTPKKPLFIYKVSNPKRQAEDEERVRNDEVYHVCRGLIPQLQRTGKNVYSHHVEDKSNQKHQAENHAIQRVLELITLAAVHVILICWTVVISLKGAVMHF